jgi:hypothetical protein
VRSRLPDIDVRPTEEAGQTFAHALDVHAMLGTAEATIRAEPSRAPRCAVRTIALTSPNSTASSWSISFQSAGGTEDPAQCTAVSHP